MRAEICADSEPVKIPARLVRAAGKYKLTRRELQTLVVICGGAPWKATAALLGVHVSTVRFHVKNLVRKTGAENCTAALWRLANF